MSTKIKVTCPTCHYTFEVNLDKEKPIQTIYKGAENGSRQLVREYRFLCPRDHVYFIVPVTIDEED